MPDGSGPSTSSYKNTFNTVEREKTFRRPPSKSNTVPILQEFVAPHIESFNALFDDSGLPWGDGNGHGLLSLGLKDIGERVMFDRDPSKAAAGSWGNRMSSERPFSALSHSSFPMREPSMDRTGVYCEADGSGQGQASNGT